MKKLQVHHYSLDKFINSIKYTYDITEELFIIENNTIRAICINSDVYTITNSIKVDPVILSNKDGIPIYNFYIDESKIEVLYDSEIILLIETEDDVLNRLIKG